MNDRFQEGDIVKFNIQRSCDEINVVFGKIVKPFIQVKSAAKGKHNSSETCALIKPILNTTVYAGEVSYYILHKDIQKVSEEEYFIYMMEN